ncbi:MAG: hypothetical protein KDK44_01755, partial [Chlamydiia bacterium]|nr:hypothetical protein [Chlamydiia bacterium]
MLGHNFLFKPGVWLGEGKITLNMVTEEMGFVTRWSVGYIDNYGTIEAVQEIEIKGLSESMHNQFLLSNIDGNKFDIELENQSMGKVVGKGLATGKTLAWEFRLGDLGFEGMEFYELQEDGSYKMHAEYSTTDDFRTVIIGR